MVTEAENACETLRLLTKRNEAMENVECMCQYAYMRKVLQENREQNFAQ
jgi:hypothetical protein